MNNHLASTALIIRPASFTDITTIQRIANVTWPAAYEALLGKEQVAYMLDKFYSTASLQDQIKNGHFFFLAFNNYQAVGFASFSRIENDIYKLQKLYVLPSVQKSRVGEALLQTVETVVKSMGAEKLCLNVNRQNVAKAFYEKNGFEVIRKEDVEIGQGYLMNDFVMQKTV